MATLFCSLTLTDWKHVIVNIFDFVCGQIFEQTRWCTNGIDGRFRVCSTFCSSCTTTLVARFFSLCSDNNEGDEQDNANDDEDDCYKSPQPRGFGSASHGILLKSHWQIVVRQIGDSEYWRNLFSKVIIQTFIITVSNTVTVKTFFKKTVQFDTHR